MNMASQPVVVPLFEKSCVAAVRPAKQAETSKGLSNILQIRLDLDLNSVHRLMKSLDS